MAQTFDSIAEEFSRTRSRPWEDVVKFIDGLPSGGVILDLGCGNGRHMEVLLEGGRGAVGTVGPA